MKKTLIGLFIAMFSFGSASADAGVNIGISGNGALFAATATEFDNGTHGTTTSPDESNKESEHLGAAYASIFIEKELGIAFIGVDYVPSEIETDTVESLRNDCTSAQSCAGSGGGFTQQTNTVKVEFSDIVTAYVGAKIGETFYVKAGVVSVDLATKETLGTGSTYGNTSMDGTMIGLGGQANFDNGMFVRGEANYIEFDPVSLTSDTGVNKITVNSLDGVSGKISIGASF